MVRLPPPTGPYGIGTVTYHWVDAARAELFSADPQQRRELMVQLWYPARPDVSAPRAPYVPDASVLAPIARLLGLPDSAMMFLQEVSTNAIPSAPVAEGKPRFPVLVFSHGRCGFRQHNTILVEELVSHGYIVAGIDHPYVAAGVRFPDGRVAEFDQRMFDPAHVGHPPFLDRALPFLAEDVVFTLNQLVALDAADPNGILTGRLDLERVGMFGASLGGAIGAQACAIEPRFKACLVMDVFMPADVVEAGLAQPTLFISRDAATMKLEGWAQEDIDETQDTMRATFDRLREGYLVLAPGMFHADFSDVPFLATLSAAMNMTGTVDRQRARDIVNRYSIAFFDRHLKGKPAPLLEGPSDQFPGVSIEVRRA